MTMIQVPSKFLMGKKKIRNARRGAGPAGAGKIKTKIKGGPTSSNQNHNILLQLENNKTALDYHLDGLSSRKS